ncbi:MAG TPA: aminopeptidase, partial [Oxalobacteraceae bacterium]|nr:aminopeptidase [Oxalobacteraceae bacterium]
MAFSLRTTALAVMLLVGAAAGSPSYGAEPASVAHQPQIDDIVAAISARQIEAYVKKLVSFQTRHT